jgi:hypothetical protein
MVARRILSKKAGYRLISNEYMFMIPFLDRKTKLQSGEKIPWKNVTIPIDNSKRNRHIFLEIFP